MSDTTTTSASTTVSSITTDSQTILNTVNTLLPTLEALSPAVAQNAQLISLITSSAAALIPLINLIPVGGTITVQAQAAQLTRVYSILAGSPVGPEWKIQV